MKEKDVQSCRPREANWVTSQNGMCDGSRCELGLYGRCCRRSLGLFSRKVMLEIRVEPFLLCFKVAGGQRGATRGEETRRTHCAKSETGYASADSWRARTADV